MDGVKPRSLRKSPKYLWNVFDSVFNTYKDCFRTTNATHPGPNSAPQQDRIFSAHGSVHNVFTISPAMITNPLFIATNIISLTDISLMVDKYVMGSVKFTKCPRTTSLALCCKSCWFTSKIIFIGAYFQPSLLSNLVLDGYNRNTPSLYSTVISLEMSSDQKLFPFSYLRGEPLWNCLEYCIQIFPYPSLLCWDHFFTYSLWGSYNIWFSFQL